MVSTSRERNVREQGEGEEGDSVELKMYEENKFFKKCTSHICQHFISEFKFQGK